MRDFFEAQLQKWDLASKNYQELEKVIKKPFKLKNLEGYIQYNPARAVSSLAKVDKESIEKRKCFLCDSNRPSQQDSLEILRGWNLLVNPFPILPEHYTIVYDHHGPQKLNLNIGFQLADNLRDYIVFYNDAGAGASAPDHAHFQAVPFGSLPFIEAYEKNPDFKSPFKIFTKPEDLIGANAVVNAFFWHSPKDDNVKFLAVPRRCHRPDLFYKPYPFRRAVSPGAIDMAGVVVTPFEEDFRALNNNDLENIFCQVAFENE